MKKTNSRTGYNLYSGIYSSQHKYLDSFDRYEFVQCIENSFFTLDAGAGDGRLFNELTKKSRNIVSVDLVKAMLEKNRHRANIPVVSDVLALPFRKNTFDLVIASFLLVHIQYPKDLFDEVRSVLKEGGIFVFNIIPQKKPPTLTVLNKKFTIKSWFHSPSKIENLLETNNFHFSRFDVVKEGEKWNSIVYKCRKW
ncbi:class I SAM-dependent methyltransferase [candidate division WOR-3 bacterium]|nr:class I SAM-dependent methyltransferase [candidate division WOR-3 bacterium]